MWTRSDLEALVFARLTSPWFLVLLALACNTEEKKALQPTAPTFQVIASDLPAGTRLSFTGSIHDDVTGCFDGDCRVTPVDYDDASMDLTVVRADLGAMGRLVLGPRRVSEVQIFRPSTSDAWAFTQGEGVGPIQVGASQCQPGLTLTADRLTGTVLCPYSCGGNPNCRYAGSSDRLTFDFTGGGCPPASLAVHPWSQGELPWGPIKYDNSEFTIQRKGCALTSLSMALNYVGVHMNPLQLNRLMIDQNLYAGSAVDWDPATRAAGGGDLKFNIILSTDPAVLRDLLCQGHPLIATVNLKPLNFPPLLPLGLASEQDMLQGGHFVVVTGTAGDDFTIADPAGSCGTLGCYGGFGTYQIRGYVGDPAGDLSSLTITADNQLLLTTDGAGRRTGFDPFVKQKLRDVPRSAYFLDALTDDVTGDPATDFTSYVQLTQPSAGSYEVLVTGIQLKEYTLSVQGRATDGAVDLAVAKPGLADVGSLSSFRVDFSSALGTASRLTRVATFRTTLEDIGAARTLGLIDDDGIAQGLTAKIEAASDAAARGQMKASTNVLRAFQALVGAQTSKHVTTAAAQTLLEDADWLMIHKQGP